MVNLFGIWFHLYGLLIGLGILASAGASSWLAKRRGLSISVVWNGLWWVLIPGVIGARLYHVLDRWQEVYRVDPLSSLYLWNGGLGILGAILGGAIGLWLYWKFVICHLSFVISARSLSDLAVFGLPFGQAIGRLGNLINQELYGLPTTVPWAITIDPLYRLAGYENFSSFHPLFAYEALWVLLGFLIMVVTETQQLTIAKRLYKTFKVIKESFGGFYLIWYGVGRFFLEFLRPKEFSWWLELASAQVNLAQLLSIGLIAAGSWLMFHRQ